MAGPAVIGALRVVLGADTAALDKGLDDSRSKLAAFGSAVNTGMQVVGAAVLAAAAAVGVMVKKSIDAADQVNKLSQSAGLTTEEFSKLKYAADLSDVSTEALGKSMGKLSKAMVSAASDGAGEAGRAFAAMGVTVKNQDGTLRSSSDVLADIAGKFATYKDSAEKTALAISLFGKAGAAMIPLLNQGKDGIQESAAEAEKFGLVLDKKTTNAAESFNDNLKRMDLINQGLVATVTARMLPTFLQLSETMLESKKNSEMMNFVADAMGATLKGVVTVGLTVVATFQDISQTLGALWNSAKLIASGDFSGAWKSFQDSGKKSAEIYTSLGETVSKLWSSEVPAAVDKGAKTVATATAPIVGAAEQTKNALQAFLDSQQKRIAGQTAEAETIGKSVGEQARLKIAYEANAIALAKGIALNPVYLAQIAATGDAAALAAMKIAGATTTMDVMSPAEKFNAAMAQQQMLLDAGVISLDTYGKKQQQIAEQAGATWDVAGASMAGSFATISSAFSKESSGMATAAKVFGVIQGTISMFTGAAKALELPFPANIAAVAAVLAKGASLVASIKSQTVPTGFMTGGSMTVRGSGGPDSVPVMLSPGETMDVYRADEPGPDRRGRSGGNPTVINVPMPAVTTRDFIGTLIGHINDALGDGHRLNMVPV